MFALTISIPSYPPAHQHPHPDQAADCRPPQKIVAFGQWKYKCREYPEMV